MQRSQSGSGVSQKWRPQQAEAAKTLDKHSKMLNYITHGLVHKKD